MLPRPARVPGDLLSGSWWLLGAVVPRLAQSRDSHRSGQVAIKNHVLILTLIGMVYRVEAKEVGNKDMFVERFMLVAHHDWSLTHLLGLHVMSNSLVISSLRELLLYREVASLIVRPRKVALLQKLRCRGAESCILLVSKVAKMWLLHKSPSCDAIKIFHRFLGSKCRLQFWSYYVIKN